MGGEWWINFSWRCLYFSTEYKRKQAWYNQKLWSHPHGRKSRKSSFYNKNISSTVILSVSFRGMTYVILWVHAFNIFESGIQITGNHYFFYVWWFFSNSFFSQIKISHYASSQNDLHYRNGWNYGRMGLFIVVGGVGCMLESGIQFNSSIKMITHGSTRDVLFLTAGVVLIKSWPCNANNKSAKQKKIYLELI